MGKNETAVHITTNICSAVVPRHLLLLAEGLAWKGRLLWLVQCSCNNVRPFLAETWGRSGSCLPGTEVEDGDGGRKHEW